MARRVCWERYERNVSIPSPEEIPKRNCSELPRKILLAVMANEQADITITEASAPQTSDAKVERSVQDERKKYEKPTPGRLYFVRWGFCFYWIILVGCYSIGRGIWLCSQALSGAKLLLKVKREWDTTWGSWSILPWCFYPWSWTNSYTAACRSPRNCPATKDSRRTKTQ